MDDLSSRSIFEPPRLRMPAFADGVWLNNPGPIQKENLKGQVVLIDFWDYTCVNCVRTLPYLKHWQQRYAEAGLQIIGIHAPEFKFAHFRSVLESAVVHHQLTYPILLDNQFENWSRFAVKAWPTKFLVDGRGYIRYSCQGEGHYRQTERAIQLLLQQLHPQLELPPLLAPLREEDTPGAVCFRPSPELHAGYRSGTLFSGGLGNNEGVIPEKPMLYSLPAAEEMREGNLFVEGIWRLLPEGLTFAGEVMGKIVVPYAAANAYAVLAPHPDPLALVIEPLRKGSPVTVLVKQDGRFLEPAIAGEDLRIDEFGRSLLLIDEPRLYQIVQNPVFSRHLLELTFLDTNSTLHSVSFSGCVHKASGLDYGNTFQVN